MENNNSILLEAGKLLPLMEDFYTIQGEGFHTGKPAYFIRLGGCDMGCAWCDVKESWNAAMHPLTDTDQIIERAKKQPVRSVVVTGGEPVLYNLEYLTVQLKGLGFTTFLETAGIRPLTGKWDWICLSPKKGSLPIEEFYNKAGELKVIICNEGDLKWAEINAARVNEDAGLFLQPEWSVVDKVLPVIIEYVKENPKWSISLQSHKYMNIP